MTQLPMNVDLSTMETTEVQKKPDLHVVSNGKEIIFHYSILQNTDEWDEIRKGRVTASKAQVLLTKSVTSTGKPTAGSKGTLGKGAVSYAIAKAKEIYCPTAGKSDSKYYGAQMERGHNEEDAAAKEFEIRTNYKTEHVGFISQGKFKGCSPDRLVVGVNMGLEMKSANSDVQWDRLLNPDDFKKEHFAQCQYNMYITDYKSWYLTSYNPDFEGMDRLLIVKIDRCEETMAKFDSQISALMTEVKNIIESKPQVR